MLACVQSGLYFIQDGAERLAVLVRGPRSDGWRQGLALEVMSHDRAAAEAFLAHLRRTMRQRSSSQVSPAPKMRLAPAARAGGCCAPLHPQLAGAPRRLC